MPIRSLCVTESADRHTTATFIGLHEAGIDVTEVELNEGQEHSFSRNELIAMLDKAMGADGE